MTVDNRDAEVSALVDGYLNGEQRLTDYLAGIDPSLRAEVRAQCEEAAFISDFFAGMPRSHDRPPLPRHIGGCQLIEKIGEGAMGEVHRARQLDLWRDVAVKLVRGELLHRDDFRARFHNEARVLASLDHPGIVKVIAYGNEAGWHYFVMELVRGRNLALALAELHQPIRRAGPAHAYDRIARIAAELLETLSYAHGRGVYHRDIKPSNVVLDEAGRPRLVDFGLAKAVAAGRVDTHLRTTPGALLGTPAYLSPERAARRPCNDDAPDLWSVAVILYQLLTGSLPYNQRNTEMLLVQLGQPQRRDPLLRRPHTPPALAAICCRALSPDPRDRYATAQEFGADLRRFLAREPVHALRRRIGLRVFRHLRQRRSHYLVGAAVGAIATGGWFGTEAFARYDDVSAKFATVAGSQPVSQQPIAALPEYAKNVRELLASRWLSSDDEQRLLAIKGNIEWRAQQERDAGKHWIRLGSGNASLGHAPNAFLRWRGEQRMQAAAAVDQSLATPPTNSASATARLLVEDPPDGRHVQVAIQPLDATTGRQLAHVHTITEAEITVIAYTPLAMRLPEGDYRVIVGSQPFAGEYHRTLLDGGTTVVQPRMRRTPDSEAGMIRFAAGSARIGAPDQERVLYGSRLVDYEAFWIDAREVTCEEYWQYCQTTGTRPPVVWLERYDPKWRRLPVVGVSFADATNYAEWAGKRLPTWVEWQVAAELFKHQPNRGVAASLTLPEDGDGPWYTRVHEVGTVATAQTSRGVFDLEGNVCEWTSTPFASLATPENTPGLGERHIRANWTRRTVCGSGWLNRERPGAGVQTVRTVGPLVYTVGFRCAMSAAP